EKLVISRNNAKIIMLQLNPEATELQITGADYSFTLDITTGDFTGPYGDEKAYPIAASVGDLRAKYVPEDTRIEIGERGYDLIYFYDFYGELGRVFFTPDGRVGANPLNPSYIWSISDSHIDKAPPPVLSPDGTRLATFGNDSVIRL